jgi:hypothetical protein
LLRGRGGEEQDHDRNEHYAHGSYFIVNTGWQ